MPTHPLPLVGEREVPSGLRGLRWSRGSEGGSCSGGGGGEGDTQGHMEEEVDETKKTVSKSRKEQEATDRKR